MVQDLVPLSNPELVAPPPPILRLYKSLLIASEMIHLSDLEVGTSCQTLGKWLAAKDIKTYRGHKLTTGTICVTLGFAPLVISWLIVSILPFNHSECWVPTCELDSSYTKRKVVETAVLRLQFAAVRVQLTCGRGAECRLGLWAAKYSQDSQVSLETISAKNSQYHTFQVAI